MEVWGHLHVPAALTSVRFFGTNWPQAWVGSRAGLKILEGKMLSLPWQESNHDSSPSAGEYRNRNQEKLSARQITHWPRWKRAQVSNSNKPVSKSWADTRPTNEYRVPARTETARPLQSTILITWSGKLPQRVTDWVLHDRTKSQCTLSS